MKTNDSEPFYVVIPARYGSSRLPGKPLADIGGKPMFMQVHDRAALSGASRVIVATDDQRIVEAAKRYGAEVMITADHHQSGTDRIAEVAERCAWSGDDIVVNVQGDEPLIPPELISQVAELLSSHADAAIATLTASLTSDQDFNDPNCVKVVTDQFGYAMYFTRAPIPFPRNRMLSGMARRHVGLYAYRVAKLKYLASASPCELEQVESLEQLRALWLGERIIVQDARVVPPHGVDTPADLESVRSLLDGAS